MLTNFYIIAKHFSAPFATVVGAIAVTLVTWNYQRRNTDIAKDRLKLDLFERRYEVFRAAKDILDIYKIHGILRGNPREDEAKQLLRKVREARFTCAESGRAFCKRLEEWSSDRDLLAMMMQAWSDTSKIDSLPDLLAETSFRLLALDLEIDTAFECDLRIQRPY